MGLFTKLIVNRIKSSKPAIIAVLLVLVASRSVAGTAILPNQGQWPSNVLYRADIPGGAFFLEKDQITYSFYDGYALHQVWHNFQQSAMINNQVVRIRFVGSTGATSVDNTGSQGSTYYNYFIGNNPAKWASNVHATDGVTMRNIWPGIDLMIQSNGAGIKYTFRVAPHADPSQIQLQYLGASGLSLDESDTLHIHTILTDITENPPFAWQNIKGLFKQNPTYKDIQANYLQVDSNTIGFQVGKYNHFDTLTIDPIVVFATFSGSTADNFGFTGTFNPNGNGYSGGTVYSNGFPTKTGAFQVKFQGGPDSYDLAGNLEEYGRDAGILKYSPDGTKLIWATYLGGSNNEQPHSMIVNSKGQLIIFGSTASKDFPVTSGAYDTQYHGAGDIYVCILDSNGSKLIASTYIGGSGRDGFNGDQPYNEPTGPLAFNYGDQYRGEVIVDKSDNILVASCTQSSDLITKNSFQPGFGGVQDGLVLKLTPNLSNLLWMSFLGGQDQDAAYGIHLDSKEDVFVCGGTQSPDFKTTSGTISPSPNGGIDGFLVKISQDGKSILASTFMGTSAYDQNYLVQTDGNDNVYVTGQTRGDFPVSPNVYSVPGSSQYIAKVSNDLSKIMLSTVYGSGKNQNNTVALSPSAFLVDVCGRVYVSGWGGVANNFYNQNATGNTAKLPITPDAYQKTTDGSDFHLIILSKDFGNLVYGSYFGGPESYEHVDGGTSRFDKNGIVYQSVCGGCGGFSDFPTTPGAYSRTNNGKRAFNPRQGGCNNAMFKIDLNSANFPPRMYDTLITKEVGQNIDYTFDIVDPQGDSIYVKATSEIFDPKIVSIPATFLVDSGLGSVTAHFHWVTDCNHYLGDTIVVTVTARNNSCPVPRSISHYIRIVLQKQPLPPVPDLFCIEHVDANTVRIRWSPIPPSNNLKDVILVKRWPDGRDEILKTSSGIVEDSYTDNAAPDNIDTNFRYFIYSVGSCGGGMDTGRIAGTVPEKDSIPADANIYSVSVEKNKSIRVLWNEYAHNNFYRYFLYRKTNDGSSDFRLYQVITSQTDTSFLDSDVNVQTTSYCYKLYNENQCGLIGLNGNMGCSIVLTGTSVPFENKLAWNPYQQWTKGVNHYDVYRRDPSKNDSTVGITSSNTVIFKDDSLNYDEGIYWYHVVARQGTDSNAAFSFSNEIELIQAPILYVPNAFTPNTDTRNDQWLTVPVFVKDYHMHVYNRWGEYVWHADAKHMLWDGRFKGAPSSNDCFIWQVEYTGWDGSQNYKTGYVTTLP